MIIKMDSWREVVSYAEKLGVNEARNGNLRTIVINVKEKIKGYSTKIQKKYYEVTTPNNPMWYGGGTTVVTSGTSFVLGGTGVMRGTGIVGGTT